ncbi:hypothetical protein [Gilliamella sp. Bif1-4]|uniref:hypothetical protein n=1 Tax=Gilliamella sp. Bif1-4 TaxID=3120233 RepID=UPI00080E2414|nr:hypothetical protein [Gilliamella apicola]OCG41950.1 hypothetical protein A9G25_04250 [Gilliamella apicola]
MPYNPLPKPFKAWQPWLSWFDESLQPLVADLLLQLNNVLGPVKKSQWNEQKLLSGLGDLRKRGSYEHLLTSEWLIAEEEPDEFIRRVVSCEQLFLTPMQEKSKANGVIIALFDCGTLQLGAPRLVHLILMLLLDIRSHRQHSKFYWGSIPHPSKLHLFNDISDLKLLLNKRKIVLTTDEMYHQWDDYLQQSGQNYDECWLIGANHSLNSFSTHQVNIERLIKSQEKLSVSINSNTTARQCYLTLPNEIFCTKMLSGQFTSDSHYAEIIKQSAVPINLDFNPIISANGNHILTFNRDGSVAYCITLSSPYLLKKSCRIQYHTLKSTILGIDLQGKRIVALIHEQERLSLWQAHNGQFELAEELNIDQNRPLRSFIALNGVQGSVFMLIDSDHSLYCLCFLPKKKEVVSLKTIANNVVALFKLNDNAAYYCYFDEQGLLCLKDYNVGRFYRLGGIKNQANLQYLLTAEHLWLKGFGRLAIGSEQQWRVFTNQHESVNVTIPNDWLVFGLFYDLHSDETHFLVIDQDKKQIALFDYVNNQTNICLRSPHKIVSYSYNSFAKAFSITDENGSLMLYSFITQSIRLKLNKAD